jgi:DNA-binding beta-propeller fold protein YncE
MVTIFALEQEKPLAEIEFDRAAEISLSPDDKFLYVLDKGLASTKPTEHKNGTLYVIDMATAKLVKTHDVATQPRGLSMDPDTSSLFVLAQNSVKEKEGRLFRFRGAELDQTNEIGREPQFIRSFGNHSGSFVISFEDLRVVPETGPMSNSFIALNPRKREAVTADKDLGGNVPGEVLYLPQQKKLMTTVRNRYGAPTSNVAILDLETFQVQRVVTTGRASVKFGKFMGAMALSVALSSLSYYGNYSIAASTGQPYFFYNVYVFTPAAPNIELTASPDGQFAYALNTSTNDVTIIKVADGTVVDRIAVGGSCKRVALAPGGRFVYSYTPGQVDLIDTTSNKKHLEHKLTSGKVNALHVMEQDKRLAALTSNAVLFFDTEKGTLESKIDGVHQPCLLVEPAHSER